MSFVQKRRELVTGGKGNKRKKPHTIMDSMDATIFEKDNCVIFVSLIDVGVIKRA